MNTEKKIMAEQLRTVVKELNELWGEMNKQGLKITLKYTTNKSPRTMNYPLIIESIKQIVDY